MRVSFRTLAPELKIGVENAPARLQERAAKLIDRLAARREWGRLVFLAFAALLLRLPPWLAGYPLHRDEALYGAWARMIASGRDPFLLAAWVDKPPLVLYLLAGSVAAFGASPFALRLPGMIAGVLMPLLAYGTARRLGGKRLAFLAAGLVALSPFAVLFGPTAFTDPWLAAWLLAAAWAALAARPGWAGLCLGLAVASKQNGVLAAPLVVALLWYGWRERGEWRGDNAPSPLSTLLRFIGGCALALAPVIWWDGLRQPARPSFWTRGLDTYGGLRLAAPGEWGERAAAWGEQLGYLFGAPAVTAAVLAFAGLALVLALRRLARRSDSRPIRFIGFGVSGADFIRHSPARAAPPCRMPAPARAASPCRMNSAPDTGNPLKRIDIISLILAAYVVSYLALHILVTFQPWDRYLLPLVPLLAILAARGGVIAWEWLGERLDHEDAKGPPGRLDHEGATTPRRREARRTRRTGSGTSRSSCFAFFVSFAPSWSKRMRAPSWSKRLRFPASAILAATLLWSSSLGFSARLPVGSDHWAYAGLDRVAARVAAMPWDAVVYERSLGWQLDFYFPGYPPARIWWDSPRTLVDDAEYGVEVYPNRQQWMVAATAAEGDLAAVEAAGPALAARGLALVERERILRPDGSCSFILYEILPGAAGEDPSTKVHEEHEEEFQSSCPSPAPAPPGGPGCTFVDGRVTGPERAS